MNIVMRVALAVSIAPGIGNIPLASRYATLYRPYRGQVYTAVVCNYRWGG